MHDAHRRRSAVATAPPHPWPPAKARTSFVLPTPMRVSELEGSIGGTRPAWASPSRKSIWPSTNDVSSSRCCWLRWPLPAAGWSEPGRGMPTLTSTACTVTPRPHRYSIKGGGDSKMGGPPSKGTRRGEFGGMAHLGELDTLVLEHLHTGAHLHHI